MTERQALHAYLTTASHQGWLDFAEDNGISATSICEVLGEDLADARRADDDRFLDLVKRARKVDAARRRRA